MNNLVLNKHFSVLIPDGESSLALQVLQCLGRTKCVKSYIASNNPFVQIHFSRYVEKIFNYPKEKSEEEKLDNILRIIKKSDADTVLPVSQETIRLLSKNKKSIVNLTRPPLVPEVEILDLVSNKNNLANWLAKNHLPFPETILFEDNAEFYDSIYKMSFPVLLKPTQRFGGIGIKYLHDVEKLLAFLKSDSLGEEYIVQSFVKGYDIGCNVLCRDGKILAYTTQKSFREKPNPFVSDTAVDFFDDPQVYNIVSDLVKKLNWTGIANIDLKYDEVNDQVKILEINPRFWMTFTGSCYAGINFPFLACLAALNTQLPQIELKDIRYFPPQEALKLKLSNLLRKEKNISQVNNLVIKDYLKDPLPIIRREGANYFRRIVGKSKKM